MGRIVLVGFPGCGKSTVGKKLASKLSYGFVDLDNAIEEAYHLSIPEFFAKYGENGFRTCEQKVLTNKLSEDNIVISAGGGTPCFFQNMELINAHSISVYIQMVPQSLFHRLSHAKRARPLVQNMTPPELQQYIDSTLAIREPFYLQAHLTVKGESLDVEELVDRILYLPAHSDLSRNSF